RTKPRRRSIDPIELLEDRLAPAQMIWNNQGGGNLMDAANWSGGVAPAPYDDLVFPQFTPSQNISVLANVPTVPFRSITFAGGGYTIAGSSSITLQDFDGSAGSVLAKNDVGTNANTMS